jgi:hypothetical protein
LKNNLQGVTGIAQVATKWGVERCITSFVDLYPKVLKRTAGIPGFSFHDPSVDEKVDILLALEKDLAKKQIALKTCCEKEVLEALPESSRVAASSCIPNDLFIELFGGKLSLARDKGQRIKSGCGCRTSVDIGAYQEHPCYHRCLFCYANPAP